MALKRMVVLAILLVAVWHSVAQAQERGPLVMRAEFEWTVVGVVAGMALGALIWLTDPANPNTNLAASVTNGAAWGAVLGAGFGIYVLQNAYIPPRTAERDPLDPRNRISADPVAELTGERTVFALRNPAQTSAGEVSLPLLNLHF
jgi:hypothetical protein